MSQLMFLHFILRSLFLLFLCMRVHSKGCILRDLDCIKVYALTRSRVCLGICTMNVMVKELNI